MGIVYVLCDPRPNVEHRRFYIGVTNRADPRTRLREHIWESRNTRATPKQRWVGKITDAGLKPHMFKLDYAPVDKPELLAEREIFWIARYAELGLELVNAAPGGEGRHGPLSDVTKAKMSASRKGRKFTDAHRAAMSAAQKGRKKPPRSTEWCAAHAAKMRGRKHTTETKAKISAAHRGQIRPAITAYALSRSRNAIGQFLAGQDGGALL